FILKILPLTQANAKLLYAFIGSATVISVYVLARVLGFSKRVGLLTTFSLAIMPWHLHLSRTAFEASLSVFFFVLGILLTIFVARKQLSKWWLIGAHGSLFLGFYSYHAAKIWFYPLMILLGWYVYSELRTKTSQKNQRNNRFSLVSASLMVGIPLLVISVSFIWLLNSSTVSRRLSDTTIINPVKISAQVEFLRRTSTAPALVEKIMSNK